MSPILFSIGRAHVYAHGFSAACLADLRRLARVLVAAAAGQKKRRFRLLLLRSSGGMIRGVPLHIIFQWLGNRAGCVELLLHV